MVANKGYYQEKFTENILEGNGAVESKDKKMTQRVKGKI